MAREMDSVFHNIHAEHYSQRGFTLLELVTTTAVMSLFMMIALPNFNNLMQANKIKRLATEIEWLLVATKSEAVMRRQAVYVNAIHVDEQWCIFASFDESKQACSDSLVYSIAAIDSEHFVDVVMTNSQTLTHFSFDALYGKPNANGNFSYTLGGYKLKTVVYSITGRIYTCLQAGSDKLFGYESC